jgi:hypothetical protein
MRTLPLTFGQALAALAAEAGQAAENRETLFHAPENGYLASLRERLQTLEAPERLEAVWQAVPERCCNAEKPHLSGNQDFFLASLLLKPAAANDQRDNARLFKHLNDCFWCFEEFCLVMRDFYHQSQKFPQPPN